jgi:hypothetical protein
MSDNDMAIHENVILKQAERKIQHLLLDLEEQLISVGTRVCGVNVDTRNFANMGVEISTIKKVLK